MSVSAYQIEPIDKLKKDMREAAKSLSLQEVRYIVDLYYQIQQFRIESQNQIRSLGRAGEPVNLLGWVFDTQVVTEKEIARWMDIYTDNEDTGMGKWAKSICGIGPVLSAGLLAHIDITKCPTAGHIWSFAGLHTGIEWKKGQKRPFNARLKVLCFKIGESFVKVQANENDIYGKIYRERKDLEISRNDSGAFADQAAAKLEVFKIGKSTDAYKAYSGGKLPPAHIHARARRYAVKMFLSHFWEEWYRRHYQKEPPLPYPIAFMGHAHKI